MSPESMKQPATKFCSRFRFAAALLRAAVALVAIFVFISPADRLAAQEQEVATRSAANSNENAHAAPKPSAPIQYVGPDTYILLDAQGRPQPVPGFTYEDFLAAWKQLNQTTSPEGQPRFVIENIKIEGQNRGQHADLKVDVTIHLLTSGAVDIPLGLVGAILQGDPRFSKPDVDPQKAAKDLTSSPAEPSHQHVDFDPQRGGFVVRTAGTFGERQLVSLNLIIPLLRDGVE